MPEFQFYHMYHMVSLVEKGIDNWLWLGEISWQNSEVVRSLYKPSKISLLHRYIYAVISVETGRDYRKNEDIYDDPEVIEELESIFSVYNIHIKPFKDFMIQIETPNEDEFYFYRWFVSQEEQFELLWEKLADEVFHLLFANRAFLLRFNQSLADYLQSGRVVIPPEYLNKNGVIKRYSGIPVWAKKAVYFRDHGRCVCCHRDLTGLLSTDRTLHYDHIVPLKLWGTNDPCNIQLLCGECNLKKSGNLSKTGLKYPAWWDY